MTVPESERGYILITAIWMLLLGASIVSIIMLHNLRSAKEASFDHKMMSIRYALESAIDMAIADMVFNGPRSEFARLPHQTQYIINDQELDLRVSSESGKIDVNQADTALIERALRGLGISALPRQTFVGIISSDRKNKRQFQTMSDVKNAMRQSGIMPDNFCAEDFLTVYSGLSQPHAGQMDARLSKALGQPDVSSASKVPQGSAIRIEVIPVSGPPLSAVIRTSGLIGQQHSILDWQRGPICGDEARAN